MKWPLKNSGATYLRDVTDTVQYSDSQCTVYSTCVHTAAPEKTPQPSSH